MTWERAEAAKAPVAVRTFYGEGVAGFVREGRERLKRNRKFFRDYIKTGDGNRVELKFRIEASSARRKTTLEHAGRSSKAAPKSRVS